MQQAHPSITSQGLGSRWLTGLQSFKVDLSLHLHGYRPKVSFFHCTVWCFYFIILTYRIKDSAQYDATQGTNSYNITCWYWDSDASPWFWGDVYMNKRGWETMTASTQLWPSVCRAFMTDCSLSSIVQWFVLECCLIMSFSWFRDWRRQLSLSSTSKHLD